MTDNQSLEPLWVVFPTYEWFSMGFRMGNGESYRYEWMDMYKRLSDYEKKCYQDKWPEPQERGWKGFYESLKNR